MGKTTLTTALKHEGDIFTFIAKRLYQVSGVDKNTAGVIPHDIHSKKFGRAIIYDFAGHEEFYSSHDVMLRSSIAGSSAVFLLVVDLCLSNEKFRESIMSWLVFLENQDIPDDPSPHIIIVGSHIDKLNSPSDLHHKEVIVTTLVDSPVFSSFHFAGFVPMDCRYAESSYMTKLRQQISLSCTTLQRKEDISITCQCLFVYLVDQFHDCVAIRVKEALSKVQAESMNTPASDDGILSCIPDDPTHFCKLLEDLHKRGNILLLRDTEEFENSWVITDREAILSQVTGSVFAPNAQDFKEYKNMATSTGIVPFSKLGFHFKDLDPNLIAEFLCHFEFCHEVTDTECQQLLATVEFTSTPSGTSDELSAPDIVQTVCASSTPNEKFFFFPGLVRIDRPADVWVPGHADFGYFSGWILHCLDPDKFFTRRFLHVLLLRLAFGFAFAQEADATSDHLPMIQRKCSIWKNGIHWGDRSACTEALVEVVEGSRKVNVMVRCLKGKEMDCVQFRSALIRKILSIKDEFCSRVSTSESFVHPADSTCYPTVPEAKLASYQQISLSVAEGSHSVLDKSGKVMDLDALLHFEPYAHLGGHILQELFDKENSDKMVSNEFLYRIADCVYQKKDTFIAIFKPPATLLHDRIRQAPQGPTHELVEVIKTWREQSEGSYRCLHRKLDQFSIFAGRNPLVSFVILYTAYMIVLHHAHALE